MSNEMRDFSRRSFLKSVGVGAAFFVALSLVGGSSVIAAKKQRPNVLIINGDDLGTQLGCYGDKYVRTPNMDAIADQGIRFATAWVTQPSCSPSRSSIYTGLYPHQNGQIGLCHRGYSMHKQYPTITSELRKAGYKTGVIGKFHIEPKSACPWDMIYEDKSVCYEKRDVKTLANVAREFIDESADDPFFLMLNYIDPHAPLSSEKYQLPKDSLKGQDVEPLDYIGIDTPEIRQQTADYYNCIGRMDEGVGLVIEDLKKTGKYEDTLIIVIGDHGAPFTRIKTACYDMGLSIPFIMNYPKANVHSVVSDQMVSTVDIFPTILDFARIRKPDDLAGVSLVDFLYNPAAQTREYMFGEHHAHQQFSWFPRRTVRDHRYQLVLNLVDRKNPISKVDGCIIWKASRQPGVKPEVKAAYDAYNKPPRIELFDLQEDPYCYVNQADNPRFDKIKNRLLIELTKWRMDTNDPYLDKKYLDQMTKKHDRMTAEYYKK